MSEFKIQKSFLPFSLIALTAEHRSKKATWNWWFREEFEILWKLDQFLSVVNSKQENWTHESDQGFVLGPWTARGICRSMNRDCNCWQNDFVIEKCSESSNNSKASISWRCYELSTPSLNFTWSISIQNCPKTRDSATRGRTHTVSHFMVNCWIM